MEGGGTRQGDMVVLLLGWAQDLPCGHRAHPLPGYRGGVGEGCRQI